jgi:N-acyl-D-aspartate/D-glutamate deacylase
MPHLIRTVVMERKALPLARAIHKLTEFPARRAGIRDRGTLEEGQKADVIAMDLEALTDRATIAEPCRYSEGVMWAFVNGVAVIENGRTTEAKPGEVLRRRAGR